jgi:eukaryotic-like serine/threonine-protein kinase
MSPRPRGWTGGASGTTAGGMGAVYEAQQDRTGRRVAIKVIRPELISAELSRRFEHEVRVLARLQHPGIAQVFEAGHVETGGGQSPYFAMEFVEGRPLTAYAAEQKLALGQKLELFLKVCEAVEHAHRKGVIHRDLKPANILVDAGGQPRILDFGVARATDADLAATTLHTEIGKLVGTLPYMSPEQVGGDPDALDTRSDVYSLGVVLYELLAGKPPYEISRGRIHEAARVIRQKEPARLGALNKAFKGDLETIVRKALEKERDRRYQSVGDLGADLRRYVARQPIEARPPSRLYQVTRFAQRNRLLVWGTAGVLTLLSAVSGTTIYLLVRQSSTLALLKLSEQTAQEERATAQKHQAAAEHEAAVSRAVNSFLDDLISSPDPAIEGRDIKVIDVLDGAMEKADARFANQPDVGAAVVLDVGRMYLALGEFDRAHDLTAHALATLEKVLGPDHPDTVNARADLGAILCQQGDYAGARDMLAPVIARQSVDPGPRSPDTLHSMNAWMLVLNALGQSKEAAEVGRRTVALTAEVLGPEKPETLARQGNLATILMDLGEMEEAAGLLDSVVTVGRRVLGPGDPRVIGAMQNLAALRRVQGRLAEAESLLTEALDADQEVMGKKHPQTLNAQHNLASLLFREGKKTEGMALLRETLDLHREVLGPDHPNTLYVESTWATMLADAGRLDEAVASYRHVMEVRSRILGEHHPVTLTSVFNLARTLEDQGKLDEAIPLLDSVVAAAAKLESNGAATAGSYGVTRGRCLMEAGRTEEAERQLLESYGVLQGVDPEGARAAARALASLYDKLGRAQEAVKYRAVLGAEEQGTAGQSR